MQSDFTQLSYYVYMRDIGARKLWIVLKNNEKLYWKLIFSGEKKFDSEFFFYHANLLLFKNNIVERNTND